MRQRNVCKFIPTRSAISLDVHNFVHETDSDVMKNNYVLSHHRAILVCEGTGTVTTDERSIGVSRGTLIFAFAGEIFRADGEGLQYMYISFTGDRSDELFKRFGIGAATRSYSGFDGIIPLWQESLTRASEENIDLSAESILLYTFSRLSSGAAKTNDIVNKVISLSEECFTERDLSIGTIASELGYNAKYLSHLFKDKIGVTYSEYLRNLRIKYAISLFDHGIDSVKNVALLSGFGDPLYFSSVFKKSVGISPTQYIESNNKRSADDD
ncbi:MAG: AraC family transcriptional regulator [Clostridia bacterium]|nr:AraC family transcriptional regulator [Clostridia bacterium]